MAGLRTIGAIARAVRDGRRSELRDVLDAQVALVQAQLLLMTRSRGAFSVADGGAGASSASEAEALLAERWASAVLRAARHGLFRPRCLARAIALSRLLSSHGVGGHTIRIGVSQENGRFVAHAWVERGASILGDSAAYTRKFAPLTNVRIGREFFA